MNLEQKCFIGQMVKCINSILSSFPAARSNMRTYWSKDRTFAVHTKIYEKKNPTHQNRNRVKGVVFLTTTFLFLHTHINQLIDRLSKCLELLTESYAV